MDVTNEHHNAPDMMHAAAISIQAGTDLSCSIWAPGFNTLGAAVKQGVVSEDLLTVVAERLYTARFKLGMFDAPGINPYGNLPFAEIASEQHGAVLLKAAEESIVLLKNSGALPLMKPKRIAVVGPTADLLTSLEGNYNGQAPGAVSPLDGITKQFTEAAIHYAQGATLAAGFSVPVPRTVFEGGLKTEYFAMPDWTGRPVAVGSEPGIQHNWRDVTPVPEIQTT
jgi:beta-glucosidase